MIKGHHFSRRDSIRKSAAATLGFSIIPAYLTSARAENNPRLPPSRRINLGCIGVGGRAAGVIPSLTRDGAAVPVAFCDVDFSTSNKRAENLESWPDVPRFNDFRVMLDKMGNDIDAVSVVTPDHTHFTAAIHAMSMGKHVYVEKPLTHTFQESEILMRAEKKFKVVTQMGNQGHTSSGAAQFRQMRDAGLMEDVYKIEAWKDPSLWFMKKKHRISAYPPEERPPESLHDWNQWCGPQEVMPFNSKYHPGGWRAFHKYGCGMFGDWGCHIIDFVHDYLKLGLPTEISPLRLDDYNQVIFPLSSHIRFRFPERGPRFPSVELMWRAGADCNPVFDAKYGDPQEDGSVRIPDFGNAGTLLHRKQGDYVIMRGHHGDASRIYPRVKMMEHMDAMKAPKPEYSHGTSFIQACMGNTTTTSPFSVSGELTQVLNLGMIAEYLNVDLKFDPENKQFVGNDEANVLLKGATPRPEWAQYYKLA
ncbi:Gfo/Idh/MocA family protein [Pontiella sulfatireligans]|uniref:Scyllo-inositol 2-dehydrogenase (NAD(+)) n=1 Tax=Pontiella sulfatireligans TaxID=2750658 RepID=A0A6C2ULC7_9BACT|nr:Gfo/Idh/MocA family oxidoreductase [Pontiella sulfatireligans]VGO20703.1 scyllo-inositol 2-dehydrogenase (NAD(+)) [Pontiella sulfatireligans]